MRHLRINKAVNYLMPIAVSVASSGLAIAVRAETVQAYCEVRNHSSLGADYAGPCTLTGSQTSSVVSLVMFNGGRRYDFQPAEGATYLLVTPQGDVTFRQFSVTRVPPFSYRFEDAEELIVVDWSRSPTDGSPLPAGSYPQDVPLPIF
jgi:hypothetical protein